MRVGAEEMTDRFQTCFAAASPLAFPGALADEVRVLERQWWRELVVKMFEPYGPFEKFEDYFAELFTHFGKADSWALYPETRETLLTLENRGLILAVVSNFDSRVYHILAGLGIAACFDSIFLSSQVGYAKPAPEIFNVALAHHQLSANETLHVGDSPEHDAAGAIGAGLTAVLVDRANDHGLVPYARVRSLKEIVRLADAAT
jgi:putative hydrolase of the HAD superfamily